MNRVLIIRFSSLGDIVLSSAVVNVLRARYPNLSIDFLVHERFSPIVEHFDPLPNNILSFPRTTSARQLPAFARELSENHYDLVIDLHDSLRSKVLRRLLKSPALRTYHKPRFKRWLLFYGHLNRFSADYSVVREYLRFAGLDDVSEDTRPQLTLSNSRANEICGQFGLSPNSIACVPGAAWPQKSWLPERYAKLFHLLPASTYSQVVLLGSSKDHSCDQIASLLPTNGTINLMGKTNLEEALAVLSMSKLAIGSDTGLLHAAEALNVPVTMILGPTSKETGARVHHPDSRIIETDLWCRPCSQNGKRKCYRSEQYCITNISVDEVVKEVTSMLGIA